MSVLIDTVARPYAKAIFAVTVATQQWEKWQQQLNRAATLTTDPQIAPLLDDPNVLPHALSGLFNDLLPDLDSEGQRFFQLLIEYKRLLALPQIATEFARLVAEHEKHITVAVTSAFDLSSSQHQQLLQALQQRLQCQKVTLTCEQDSDLIGGAVIRIGDTVIDGSLLGKLNRLRNKLEENRL